MKRRAFIAGGCALCASGLAAAQSVWSPPARFARPDAATDEGGLWAIMDREEVRLRRSPFVLRDADLRTYIQDMACRMAGDHCPDIRVHIMRTPLFNASMAPNGMMEVWTGLLLRVENEAQLAGIIGHEIAHYLLRHSVERLRALKSGTAAAQIMGLFGLVGALGQLAITAGLLGYTRDQEREADQVGMTLMKKAGYDPREVPKVWANLELELKARPESEQARFPLFQTHPSSEEREAELKRLAETMAGGIVNSDLWQTRVRAHRKEWLIEEIKRGRYDESIALMTRLMRDMPRQADFPYARGEIYRLRAGSGDHDAALADFAAAVTIGSEPPETHRGMGVIYRARNQPAEAKASFQRYLELAPNAPDQAMIRSYIEEIGT
jgi:predicted Zn-dependent protease